MRLVYEKICYSIVNKGREGGIKMKLYIKQQVFSFVDRFYIKDEMGNNRYYVEGEFLSLGKRLHLYDLSGHELVYIEQKIWNFLPTFEVYVHGGLKAKIIKEFNLFARTYRIEGLNWYVQGDFWAHEYAILDGISTVVEISKEWFTWGDSYMLSIENDAYELDALAVVLTIDACMASSSNSSNRG